LQGGRGEKIGRPIPTLTWSAYVLR
jgi:hypothetical protein